jgi:hypothetical protein
MATKKAEPQSLVKKLVEILKVLGPVEKNKRNAHFGYNYTSEGQIMAILGPRLAASGILFTTSVEEFTPHIGEGKAGVYVTVKTVHTFRDGDTGETLEVRGAGMGWDTGDKAMPKAITGATKSALMKNFMTTDETDPENEVRSPQASTGDETKTGQGKHAPTRPYEEATGDNDHASATDLLELKAFMTENKIPDDFLLALLREKGLSQPEDDAIGKLKPGVIRRCLSPNSKENLVKAWAAQKKGTAAKKKAANKPAEPPAESTVTNDGDQRRDGRVFCKAESISASDLLEQDGYDNWREVKIHFGNQKGETLGTIGRKSLAWWIKTWTPKPYRGKLNDKDVLLDAALFLAYSELGGGE